ncbi:hypothetical protein LC653_31630 [Nostoc sp. CHAB 5784]|uniref:hypothetical protein n=1 Tax=Nostoc mirabile TaxID=2907820 RepID=UPI001E5263C0|nr:hypothetical protein [Nostoc mirabile]MCC5668287.1 hypothetical protein [Nostoc mirabile CHAB5784]
MSVETMALSAETMALSVETVALSVETMALSAETMALSAETMALLIETRDFQIKKYSKNWRKNSLLLIPLCSLCLEWFVYLDNLFLGSPQCHC